MNAQYLRNVIEAGLLAAGRPLSLAELAQLFDEAAPPTSEELRAAIDALRAEYAERALKLKETAGGIRIQVRREFAAEVARLWPERPPTFRKVNAATFGLGHVTPSSTSGSTIANGTMACAIGKSP